MPRAYITDISRLPLFTEINAADCTLLFDCLGCRIRRYGKDEFIRFDNELKESIGTVLEGSIHLSKEDVWGNRTLVSYLNTGDVFGESCYGSEDGLPPGIHYQAASTTLVLFLPAGRILHPCKNSCPFHHRLSRNLFRLMSIKNRMLMERIEVSSRGSVRDKILSYLSLEAQRQGTSSFHIPLRRQEMADYLCVNRSALSRELSILQSEGILDYERNFFTLYTNKEEITT